MSRNTLVALAVTLRVLAGVAIVAGGVYLMISHHPIGGGWTIAGGILTCLSSVIADEDDNEDE